MVSARVFIWVMIKWAEGNGGVLVLMDISFINICQNIKELSVTDTLMNVSLQANRLISSI